MEPQRVGSIEILISYVYLYLMEYPHPRGHPEEPSPLAIALCYAEEASDYLPAYKAFTCSPDPTKYKSHDPGDQWRTLLNCVLLQKRIKRCFTKFLFVPELNENGNIHFHGYYSVANKYEYNRWFLPACKRWGWCRIKDRVDDYWTFEYVTEDIEEMEEVLPDLPVVITDENFDELYDIRERTYRFTTKYTMSKMKSNKDIRSKYLGVSRYFLREMNKKYPEGYCGIDYLSD